MFFHPLTPHPDDQLLAPEFCDPDDITQIITNFIEHHALDPAKVAEVHAAPDGTLSVRQLAGALQAMLATKT